MKLREFRNHYKKITEINPNSTIYVGEYIPINISEFNQQDNYVVFSGIGNHNTFVSMIKNINLI